MVKAYLAGPDVFLQNSIEIGQHYKALCKAYNIIGLYPLDNEINLKQNREDIAKEIFQANINLIQQSEIVIANLNPFRGKEADSGTIWECGYAKALGKKVYGYMSSAKPYVEQFDSNEKKPFENGEFIDQDGKIIENFNLPINLMIACSVEKIIEGELEDVLKSLS